MATEAAATCAAAMFDATIDAARRLEPELNVRNFADLPEHLQRSVINGLANLVPVMIRVATPTPAEKEAP